MAKMILRLTEQAKLPQRLRIKVMWWKLSWTCDLGLAGKQKLRATYLSRKKERIGEDRYK